MLRCRDPAEIDPDCVKTQKYDDEIKIFRTSIAAGVPGIMLNVRDVNGGSPIFPPPFDLHLFLPALAGLGFVTGRKRAYLYSMIVMK